MNTTNPNDSTIELYIKRYYESNKTKYTEYDFTVILLERYGDDALLESCKNKRYNTVRYLVENGANVNARGKNNTTALMIACEESFPLDIIQSLLDHGANPNDTDNNGDTALIRACLEPISLDIVKCLVEHKNGADVNIANKKGACVLFGAIKRPDVIQYLLDHGANVDCIGNYCTPLMVACVFNEKRTVKCLLKAGANVFYTSNDDGFTVLMSCVTDGDNVELLKYMIKHVAKKHGKDKANELLRYTNYRNRNILDILERESKYTHQKSIAYLQSTGVF